MELLKANLYRLKLQAGIAQQWKNAITSEPLRIPSGTHLQLDVGVFRTAQDPYDLTDVVSLSLEVKAMLDSGPPLPSSPSLMSQTLEAGDITPQISAEGWSTLAAQHASFEFTAEESNVTVTGPTTQYWLVLSAVLTGGKIVSLGWGIADFVQDGTGPINPAEPIANYLSLELAESLFAKHGNTGLAQLGLLDSAGRANALQFVNRRVDLDAADLAAMKALLEALTTDAETPDIRGVGTVLQMRVGSQTQEWELRSGTAADSATTHRPADYEAVDNEVYWLRTR